MPNNKDINMRTSTRHGRMNREQNDSLRNERKIKNTNSSMANNDDVKARKKKSVDRVKQLGLRSVKMNIDDSTYDKLNKLCDSFDINISNRNGQDVISATDLGLLIKMFVSTKFKYTKIEYIDAYCRSVRNVIKDLVANDSDITNNDIAKQLNDLKVKRHSLLRLPKVDARRNTKWSAEHVAIFREERNFNLLCKRFPKLNDIINVTE